MRNKLFFAMALCWSIFMAFISANAAEVDHRSFIKGPFKDGRDVTKSCLVCHDKQATDFMKTTHWTWKGTPNHIKGRENSTELYGKTNMLNNYCVSIEGGENGVARELCGSCHAGYGWTRNDNFNPQDKTRIDCLVCHSRKGGYNKTLGGEAGRRVDLVEAAGSVAQPALSNCGSCHFFGGGGDAVKHAGLDSTLETATKSQDVHMASRQKGGQGMQCQSCHKTVDHRIAGASSQMPHYETRVSCEDCHSGAKAPHRMSAQRSVLDRHTATVACQTCHIPVFSKGQATKTMWLWSDVGKDIDVEEQFDKEAYLKHKGTFRWEMNVRPTYAWYNGKVHRYMKGDRISKTASVVYMTRPDGDINDKTAKIFPYKVHLGNQPMDSVYRYLLVFQNYKGLWTHYNWDKALIDGAKGSGLPYSGKFEFVKTAAYVNAQHEVAPKENALACSDCHGDSKRMDWKALGYSGDPMKIGGRFSRHDKK